MRILKVTQGTPEWLAERAKRRCASDAPTIMGAGFITRQELVRQRALAITPEFAPEQQRRFDAGHEAEAAARWIADGIIGEELYPVTCVTDDDLYLASMDGLTMLEDVGFEHKLLNAKVVAQVQAGELEPRYYWQLEHALMVTGAEKILFVCSDGTEANFYSCWYKPVPGRREELLAAWEQFDADVKSYVHKAVPDQVVAAEQPALPVVIVKTEGSLTVRDNLPEFGVALKAYIARLPAKPSTDQEFADADAAVRVLKKAEDALQAEEDRALSSMTTVEALRTTIANLRAIARQARLATERVVEKRKVEIRAEIVAEYRTLLSSYAGDVSSRLCDGLMPWPDADWAVAMKGKKTVQGLRDGCDGLLATQKIAVNERATVIRGNLDVINAAGRPHLFADKAPLVLKDPEAVKAIVTGRIAEDDRRIQAQKDAAEKAAREKLEREAEEARQRAEREAQAALPVAAAPTVATQPAPAPAVTGGVVYPRTIAPTHRMVTGSGVSSGLTTGPDKPNNSMTPEEQRERATLLLELANDIQMLDLEDVRAVKALVDELSEAYVD